MSSASREFDYELNAWVSATLLDRKRKQCKGTVGGGTANSAGIGESWFWCDWCGEKRTSPDIPLCPKYPFYYVSLSELMEALGHNGMSSFVRYDPCRNGNMFTVMLDGYWRVDTDGPLSALVKLVRDHWKGGSDE